MDVGETMKFESLSKGWVWSLGDIVKHVLRVMSYELQAACLEARVGTQKCEFISTSYEFKSSSYKF